MEECQECCRGGEEGDGRIAGGSAGQSVWEGRFWEPLVTHRVNVLGADTKNVRERRFMNHLVTCLDNVSGIN